MTEAARRAGCRTLPVPPDSGRVALGVPIVLSTPPRGEPGPAQSAAPPARLPRGFCVGEGTRGPEPAAASVRLPSPLPGCPRATTAILRRERRAPPARQLSAALFVMRAVGPRPGGPFSSLPRPAAPPAGGGAAGARRAGSQPRRSARLAAPRGAMAGVSTGTGRAGEQVAGPPSVPFGAGPQPRGASLTGSRALPPPRSGRAALAAALPCPGGRLGAATGSGGSAGKAGTGWLGVPSGDGLGSPPGMAWGPRRSAAGCACLEGGSRQLTRARCIQTRRGFS